nr:LysM peptidoglycan-binding domain-containing protein [Microbacterium hydrocarbonoxydans]
MTTPTAARRTRYLRLGVPAAVLGTLSGALAAVPASASADSAPVVHRLASSAPRAVPAEAAPGSYTVQPGDTVYSIATRFSLRTADVLAWNGLGWRSVIHPGQSLTLTAGSSPAPAAAPATTPSTAPTSATHAVVAGDTVFGIARTHGTTVDAVLAANGLDRSSVIYPGQALAIPGTSAAVPAPAAAPAAVSAPAPSAATGGATHAVAAGDTLFGIARTYGTTTATLLALNGLGADAIIYPGQSILVAAPAPAPAPAAPAGPPAQLFAGLDAEQAANARLIIAVGRDLGVSDRAIAIGLATAMVESSLRNVAFGDRDSLGLFQQRPSTGWGTPEQITDADRSTRVFFGGAGDPNGQSTRGLLDIGGWEGMPFTQAAQAVQISAYPERYGQWETQAYQWLAQHG